MKKIFLFIALGIFLTSLVFAAPITSYTTKNSDSQAGENLDNAQATQNKGDTSKIQVQERNRLKIGEGECQEGCTCTGSATKCQLQNGREMTITAGNSGNTIVQVKGEQMRTQVQLYKEDGKLYGQFKNNQTKIINAMPDQIKQKIRERLQLQNCSCDVELDEDGNYQVQAKKRARLFGFISTEENVNIELNAETGEIKRVRNSWWGFLAKDVEEEPIVGASCGTVTPGYNNECCQTKGYNYWNSEKGECLFNESE